MQHYSELGGRLGGVLCPQNELVQGAGHGAVSTQGALPAKPCVSAEWDSHAISQKGGHEERESVSILRLPRQRRQRKSRPSVPQSSDLMERECNVTCTPVFITALFTIARTWKQPRCPMADEAIRKLWYIHIHNEILLSS